MERGWTKGGNKGEKKTFFAKETCCEGDQEKWNKKRHGSKKKVQKQVKTTYFAFFWEDRKQERENTKERYSP